MTERRSAWTGQAGERLIEVRLPAVSRWGARVGEQPYLVEPEHEAELRRFVTFAARFGRTALVVFVASGLLALGGALTAPAYPPARWLVVAALLLLGAGILVFPFSTPETVSWLGIQRSRRLARRAGVFLLVLAVATLAVYAST